MVRVSSPDRPGSMLVERTQIGAYAPGFGASLRVDGTLAPPGSSWVVRVFSPDEPEYRTFAASAFLKVRRLFAPIEWTPRYPRSP